MWYMIDGICHLEQPERSELGAAVIGGGCATGNGCASDELIIKQTILFSKSYNDLTDAPVLFSKSYSGQVCGLDEASVLWFVV